MAIRIDKIVAGDPASASEDVVKGNVERLRELFPEAFTEGGGGDGFAGDGRSAQARSTIDFDVLKQLLGGAVNEREEKYGLNWNGKRKARQLALTPSTGTLRPCPGESVDWEKTKNIFIEGDNLEVLKLLQKSYAGKVKLIYIDPPYNTGGDLVYPDDFKDGIRNYKMLTGQLDSDGRALKANTEADGRLHTNWLNMMYPRLRLARSLLQQDGLIFVSISDHEVSRLRQIMDELFGSENFVAQLVWKSRQFPDSRAVTRVSTDHEYLLVFAMSEGGVLRGIQRDETKFANPDHDPRGPWMSRSLLGLASATQRPNLHYSITDPDTDRVFAPPENTGWRYGRERMADLIKARAILFPAKLDGRPREKKFRRDIENEFVAFPSIIDDLFTAHGTAETRKTFGEDVFDFAKPVKLLERIVEQTTEPGDLVLDFFAGSGTVGEAAFRLASRGELARRFVLVQLPEPTVRDDFKTIAEIAKERLRRAGAAIRKDNPLLKGDTGFRTFKLDTSNIRAWAVEQGDVATSLVRNQEHLFSERSEDDILYEVLLKLGLDLTLPVVTREFGGLRAHCIGAGTLFVCLARRIDKGDIEILGNGLVDWKFELAPLGETTVIFRDSAFQGDDVAKTNLLSILEQHDIKNVRGL